MEIPGLRNKLREIKISTDGFKISLGKREEQIDELEDKAIANLMLIPKVSKSTSKNCFYVYNV